MKPFTRFAGNLLIVAAITLTVTAVAGLLVFFPEFRPGYLNRDRVQAAWAEVRQSSPELITVRYTVQTLYCIDKDSHLIEIAGIGLWRQKSRACWKVKSDVLAGYEWKDLGLEFRQGILIKAPKPKILGVDYRGAQLIYQQNWQNLDMAERDFLAPVRDSMIKKAEQMGIEKDAEQKLAGLADLMQSRVRFEQVRVEALPLQN